MSFLAALANVDEEVLGHLGGPVRYQPEFGDPVDVVGIFDAAYARAAAGTAGVESSGPAVFLRLADLPTDPDDDEPTITANGTAYGVARRQKDGTGGVVLFLQMRD